MATYDFSTLNSSDLEELACDLLNLEQTSESIIRYKTFKDGKDKGIDLLYSSSKNIYEHVGQVKHYYRSGYAKMLNDIKKTEVKKVKELSPKKYLFVTSVDLSEAQTEEVKLVFRPFIKNLNDIYGKKDLNQLIEKNKIILENHYKLWLSDFSILRLILSSQLQFRSSDFVEHELKKRLRLYINTPLLQNAQSALEKNKFVIITGQPGVGKTTLAEMLIYKYLAEDFNVNYVLDIKEAESILVPDGSKQIIYFDDFLGSNAVEINKARGTETRLRSVLRRISHLENKYIVFTTRVHIINRAIEESEQLRIFNLKAKTSLFELEEYTPDLKRQLIKTHIEESEMPEELKDIIYSIEIMDFLAKHASFTPRAVEFITSKDIVGHLNPKEYKDFIFNSFKSLEEIWQHAYTEQIKENDRLLLSTLLSFGDNAHVDELEAAFVNRLAYEVEYNNAIKEILAFSKSFKRLEGGFIILKNDIVSFINPSVVDFLLQYLRKDKDEILRIANTVMFASQLTERLFSLGRFDIVKMPQELQNRLIDDYSSFVSKYTYDYDLIQIALVIHKYVTNDAKSEVICEIIETIQDFETLHRDYYLNTHFRDFMKEVKSDSKIYTVLEKRILEIITDLVKGEYDIDDAIALLEDLKDSFDIDLTSADTFDIERHFDYLFDERIDNDIEMLKEYIYDESEAGEKLEEIKSLVEKINDIGLLGYEPNLEAFDIEWYDIVMHNEFKRQMEKDD